MRGLDTGRDKVKKICDLLRKETLEPAMQEAHEIIDQARTEAERILQEAKAEAARIHKESRQEIEKQKNIFEASLRQASRQVIEGLKQAIEEKLFHAELGRLIAKETQSPSVIAKMIQAIIDAVEKGGVETDLSVVIPASLTAREVNQLLGQEILHKLREKSVLLGAFAGGVEVKLHRSNITLDLTDAALKELLARYIRKDFRELFFGSL